MQENDFYIVEREITQGWCNIDDDAEAGIG
jgi:hypothetical protein